MIFGCRRISVNSGNSFRIQLWNYSEIAARASVSYLELRDKALATVLESLQGEFLENQFQAQLNSAIPARSKHRIARSLIRRSAPAAE
jgi:hypothetical protein